MVKFALLGASALVLALGVASASAEPSGQQFLTRGDLSAVTTIAPNAAMKEGRAAAIEAPASSADGFIWQQHHGR